jgi:glycosyltransferase involved in cell wall biosynthesis
VPGFRLVVVSEGAGADYIREHAGAAPVTVLPFQPFEVLPDVLASGDVLIVILEPHAGEYSVPSKTLSYLCAARAVVALLPATNPAFETVQNAGGLAYDLATLDASTVAEDVAGLLLDEEARVKRGQAARRYAEHAFDIERISAEFDAVLERATSSRLDVDKHARV